MITTLISSLARTILILSCWSAVYGETILIDRKDQPVTSFHVKNDNGEVELVPNMNNDVGAQLLFRAVYNSKEYIRIRKDGFVAMFLQSDGNLVIRSRGPRGRWGANIWDAGAHGPSDCQLVFQDDGKLVIRSKGTGKIYWENGVGK